MLARGPGAGPAWRRGGPGGRGLPVRNGSSQPGGPGPGSLSNSDRLGEHELSGPGDMGRGPQCRDSDRAMT